MSTRAMGCNALRTSAGRTPRSSRARVRARLEHGVRKREAPAANGARTWRERTRMREDYRAARRSCTAAVQLIRMLDPLQSFIERSLDSAARYFRACAC